MRQSSIEWLEEKLKLSFGDDIKPLSGFFVIAKEMHKQEVIDARISEISFFNEIERQEQRNEAEQYYNETYNDKS